MLTEETWDVAVLQVFSSDDIIYWDATAADDEIVCELLNSYCPAHDQF